MSNKLCMLTRGLLESVAQADEYNRKKIINTFKRRLADKEGKLKVIEAETVDGMKVVIPEISIPPMRHTLAKSLKVTMKAEIADIVTGAGEDGDFEMPAVSPTLGGAGNEITMEWVFESEEATIGIDKAISEITNNFTEIKDK